ncbi:MAG: hypothetical protein ACYTFI_27460 [Planctomycetota bacterium]
MRERLRGIARWIAWVGGVFFAAVAATVLVLTMTGSVGAGRWTGAVEVLRGTAAAVETTELARLQAAKKESDALRKAKEKGEAKLLESWLEHKRAADELRERRQMEENALKLLRELADKERARIADKTAELERKIAQDKSDLIAREKELKRRASEKVKRVYRYMEAAAVAADLESRLAAGKEDEVAELVREMSDRSAAEVLEAFRDPASRMEVYKALAGEKQANRSPEGL